MTKEEIVEAVRIGFEYSYMHEEWIEPLEQVLDAVTAEGALRRPAGGMGIWDIVLHLAVWNENIVDRIRTGEKSPPSEGAWPPHVETADEVAWSAAKDRLWQSLHAVDQLLQTCSLEDIQKSPYGLPDLLCRLTHNGYHIGQIEKMREIWAI